MSYPPLHSFVFLESLTPTPRGQEPRGPWNRHNSVQAGRDPQRGEESAQRLQEECVDLDRSRALRAWSPGPRRFRRARAGVPAAPLPDSRVRAARPRGSLCQADLCSRGVKVPATAEARQAPRARLTLRPLHGGWGGGKWDSNVPSLVLFLPM